MEYEVTAVEKVSLADGGEAVVAIGNNRRGWQLSAASAIHRITTQHCLFYVVDHMSDQRAYLAPAKDDEGRLLLKTAVAGASADLLMHLPTIRECDVID